MAFFSQLIKRTGVWFSIVFLLVLTPGVISGRHILHKGEVEKQFSSYSITESLLANPLSIFNTSLPCENPLTGNPPLPWAEEPPLFHLAAVFLSNMGLKHPSAAPLFFTLILLVGLFFFSKEVVSQKERAQTIFLLLATLPLFMRISPQHFPDLSAMSFLVLGVTSQLRGSRSLSFFFYVIAVTIKALFIFSVLPILVWTFLIEPFVKWWKGSAGIRLSFLLWNSLIVVTLACVVLLPFLTWVWLLNKNHVFNPLPFSNSVSTDYFGDWSLLLNPKYYSRALKWVSSYGVGVLLFLFACWSFYQRTLNFLTISPISRLLVTWSASGILYFLFVRSGNYHHSYYFLPIALPIATLGALQLTKFPIAKWRTLFVIVSTFLGLLSPLKLKTHSNEYLERPSYCQTETLTLVQELPLQTGKD